MADNKERYSVCPPKVISSFTSFIGRMKSGLRLHNSERALNILSAFETSVSYRRAKAVARNT
eukprot:CCRYP_016395-RA/>CCRYP_016395-RA protein AED:0.41 eAED:0.40 QI:1621/0/0.5/1/0/0/2/0/61